MNRKHLVIVAIMVILTGLIIYLWPAGALSRVDGSPAPIHATAMASLAAISVDFFAGGLPACP
jgi:hypothetical protein